MGSGGMRFGAGRPGWRPKAEACLRLDVREFARRNLLESSAFTWHWTNTETGKQVASIGARIEGSAVRLAYAVNNRPAGELVHITSTPCGFGGSRPWFACPRCERRVAVLFMRGGRFACRRCSGVAYTSQSEDAIGRSWRRQRKLERRLGDDWRRPKGMHSLTCARILEGIFECERWRDEAIDQYLARFPEFSM